MSMYDPSVAPSMVREAREWLAAFLTNALDPWVVTATKPQTPATPCTFLDIAQRRTDTSDGLDVMVTFPIVTIVDGDDSSQVYMLDVMTDQIYAALFPAGCIPTSTVASAINVGGPSLRSCVTYVDVPIDLTFCYSRFDTFNPPT